MRHNLIMGFVDVVVGLALFILCIILNRTERIVLTFFPVAVGVGLIASYIHDRKQTCWRNPTKKEMAKISNCQNCKCCATCTHVEYKAMQSTGIISCMCTSNPVRPIIENPGNHVCHKWCPGAGRVVFERRNGTRIYFTESRRHGDE